MTRLEAAATALAPFVWESHIEEKILANFCPAHDVLCDYPYYYKVRPSQDRCRACWDLEIEDKGVYGE